LKILKRHTLKCKLLLQKHLRSFEKKTKTNKQKENMVMIILNRISESDKTIENKSVIPRYIYI